MSELDIDFQTVVTLELCSREDINKLSLEDLDDLISKAKNILKTVEDLGICTAEDALNSYNYKELEELIKKHEY